MAEAREAEIEDFLGEDLDQIPTINLNVEEFAQNLKSSFQANNIDIKDADMSNALVAITPQVASIPTSKLKNVNRLRTEHQVYELPDSHPLLEGFDQREPDDPSPYLLSIWTSGKIICSHPTFTLVQVKRHNQLMHPRHSATPRKLVNYVRVRHALAATVRGKCSLRGLEEPFWQIPCRTATRGSFPLNGTYFQVNEVFADHYSSKNPIDVPRKTNR
uniref:Demeter RRM-fold domain-containing protein n=1 Tax=Oryza punctata TaxID=4537 RepID=A0A0E0K003_ORYPU